MTRPFVTESCGRRRAHSPRSTHATHAARTSTLQAASTHARAVLAPRTMAKAKVKAEALLLVALVLTSCFAASSSYCIPRRLLMVSGRPYFGQPCNDDKDRPPKQRGGGDDGGGGMGEAQGSRKPYAPPSPTSYSRAMDNPPSPGTNN